MDFSIESPDDNIREIEDIINIQKANGNFNARQVAFNLPEEAGCAHPAGLAARSFESGLTRSARARKRSKKRHGKWRKSPLADNVSWPSDSDITVLRMKRSARGAAPHDTAGDALAGDGLHRADGSSMVNLATLVLPAQSASKHSLAQELLLPLTSWERPAPPEPCPAPRAPPQDPTPEETTAKSRLARFLRLYFCPCCMCLYEMEKNMRDEPSVYLTSTRRSLGTASD